MLHELAERSPGQEEALDAEGGQSRFQLDGRSEVADGSAEAGQAPARALVSAEPGALASSSRTWPRSAASCLAFAR